PNLTSVTAEIKGHTGGLWRQSILRIARGLDWIWRALAYVVGGLIFGGLLVNIVISYLTTGTPGITDPRTWVVVQYVLSDLQDSVLVLGVAVIVAALASLGHWYVVSTDDITGLSAAAKALYLLTKAKKLNPSETYIHAYRSSVYLPRRLKFSSESA